MLPACVWFCMFLQHTYLETRAEWKAESNKSETEALPEKEAYAPELVGRYWLL